MSEPTTDHNPQVLGRQEPGLAQPPGPHVQHRQLGVLQQRAQVPGVAPGPRPAGDVRDYLADEQVQLALDRQGRQPVRVELRGHRRRRRRHARRLHVRLEGRLAAESHGQVRVLLRRLRRPQEAADEPGQQVHRQGLRQRARRRLAQADARPGRRDVKMGVSSSIYTFKSIHWLATRLSSFYLA
jgi:hypothetical protein